MTFSCGTMKAKSPLLGESQPDNSVLKDQLSFKSNILHEGRCTNACKHQLSNLQTEKVTEYE